MCCIKFRSWFLLLLLLGVFVLAGCGDDEDLADLKVLGVWEDAYGGSLSLYPGHFTIGGTGWGYGGNIVLYDNQMAELVICYTNPGTLPAGDEIKDRYGKLVWQNLGSEGQVAWLEYQELYDASQTNQAGDFIGWASPGEARQAQASEWYSWATNSKWNQ